MLHHVGSLSALLRRTWCSSEWNDKIYKISTTGNVLGNYLVLNPTRYSNGIVAGPDGNVWMASNGSNAIEKVTLTGSVTNYSVASGALLQDMVLGPDLNLWFTEPGTNMLGYITTSGSITLYNTANGLPSGGTPSAITKGPDGNIWFSDRGYIGKFVL